jgi:hypothetical protein
VALKRFNSTSGEPRVEVAGKRVFDPGYLIAKPLAPPAATAFIAQFNAHGIHTELLQKSGRLASD